MQTRRRTLQQVVERTAGLARELVGSGLRDRPRPAEPVVPERRINPERVTHFRREVLPAAGPQPWLDRPDALAHVERELEAGRLTSADAALARAWVTDGYVILPGVFSADRLTAAWAEYEAAIAAGTITPPEHPAGPDDPYPGRVLDPHRKLAAFDAMLREAALQRVVGVLLGALPLPFQTLVGHKGTQQPAHSDTIHMTSYPLGYLVAAWIALEDIHPDSGPLVYYPGSHRLPYITSSDVGVPVEAGATRVRYDFEYRTKYEPAVAHAILAHGLQPAYFTPRAGDVLLWHANLLHGGAPRRQLGYTRKALVCHYFAEGCLTYHDLSARPSHVQIAKMSPRTRRRWG